MTPPKSIEQEVDSEKLIKHLGIKSKLDYYFRNNKFTRKAYVICLGGEYIIGSYQKLSRILEKNPKKEFSIREVEKRNIDYIISKEYSINKDDLKKGKTRKLKKH